MMKKNIRKFIAIVFAVMVGANAFAQLEYYFEIGGIMYYCGERDETGGRPIATVVANDSPYSGEITIPSTIYVQKLSEYGRISVEKISAKAFMGCTGLTSVTIGSYVEIIGDSAFLGCTGLTSVEIGKSVKTIGKSAFSGCTSLTHIKFKLSNKTAIREKAFATCTSLKSITIPSRVTTIGKNVFEGCTGLDTIICSSYKPAEITDGTLAEEKLMNRIILFIPCGKKDAYMAADGWKDFKNIVEKCDNTGIEEVAQDNTISVYPNPARDVVIEADGDVTIFNNKGQTVKFIKAVKGVKEINIADLESGVYVVKVGETVKKLIIE